MNQPSPPSNSAPVPLDEIERTGATRFGQDVCRLVILLRDGRKIAVDLPAGASLTVESELTPMQAAVLQVIEEMAVGDVLTVEEIAAKSGYANSGPMREFIRSLTQTTPLRRTAKGWRKDGAK